MMRLLSASMAALLAVISLSAQTVRTIENNGPVNNRYDIVILGDGYQAQEEAKFDRDALASITTLFSKPAYGAYRSFFNVHTVFRASNESGADHPDANPPIVRDTVYDASYNTGGTPRCLYIGNTSQATADSRLAPDVEGRVIVLVNDTRYGGCAGTFAVSYTGSSGPEVQAHEFGHSFGRLADEYDYGQSGTYTGPEPSSANLTADPTGQTKWPLWLGTNGVGVFQGGGYYRTGLWRPKQDCLMRSLGTPMCEVCNEQIVRQAYVEVDPIENRSPVASTLVVQRPNTQVFSIASLVPGNASIVWKVDGIQVASGTPSFTFDSARYGSGRRVVAVEVRDLTTFVRNDPGDLLTSSTSWNVDVLSTRPGSYTAYGAGCPGSGRGPSTCLRVNDGGTHLGQNSRVGVTYAIRGTAAADMVISGIEFQTESQRSGSVTVNIALYEMDTSGLPGRRIAVGSMQIGQQLGWYAGRFTIPVRFSAGSQFFISDTTPVASVGASVVSGTPIPYYRNDGANGAWNGPFTTVAWTYRVTCLSSNIPSLSSPNTPEIGMPMDIVLENATANAAGALLFGDSNASWQSLTLPFDLSPVGAAGCSLLASANVLMPIQADAAGRAVYRLQVPNVPALVDSTFYNQFLLQDPSANQLGLVLSNAATGRIGQP